MGLPAEKHRYTVSEYLRYEQEASERHEYRRGEIIAMAGGTYNHSLIVANIIRELGNALKGKPCRVLDSNLRVRSRRVAMFTYPDASVVCGEPQFDPDDPANQTITNPRVLIEVLSPSTEAYDRGTKFNSYRQLESLEEYVLVSQDAPRIETFYRQADGTWLFTAVGEPESKTRLRSLGLELPLQEIYAGVAFPPGDKEAAT
jgi:Uma2 family endonuclease